MSGLGQVLLTGDGGPISPALFSVAEGERLIERVEEHLRGVGIAIRSGSVFEGECLRITGDRCRAADYPWGRARPEDRADIRAHSAVIHIVSNVVRQFERGDIRPFLPHLELLSVGQAGQGQRTPILCERAKQATDKVFELLVGLACAEVFEDVEMESPDRAQGDNPDVMATYRGTKWAFACKCPGSKSGLTLMKNLRKGVGQIDRSPAELGAVLMNLSCIFDHDSIFPFSDAGRPHLLVRWARRLTWTAYPGSLRLASATHRGPFLGVR